MRKKFLLLALSALLAMPCVLRAAEVEIQLIEVVSIGTITGDNPLDDPYQSPTEPPRPTDFRATINGNTLSVTKLTQTIPVANARVVKATTGSLILNRQFTSSVEEQISDNGVYILRVETEGGALVGQFMVQ